MSRLLNKILFFSILLVSPAMTAKAVCPTTGATVVEVCNDAGENSSLRVYFYDGDPGVSFFLYSITDGTYVSDPLGPVTVNPGIPLPPGAVAGVEFGGVSDGDYIVRVNCQGGGFINIGGLGITVNSTNAINATVTIDPDCNPATGGVNADGSISLTVSGGTAPFNITWPVAVTPIPNSNGVAAGNYSFPNLDGGTYTVEIRDANNCLFSTNINVPIATLPSAGADQTTCGPTANLSGNAPGPGEIGTWTGPAGILFFPNANAPNAVVSNLATGVNVLTWTITDINGLCTGNSDQVNVTSDAPATVDAGAPQAICSGSTAVLAGVIGGSATSSTWTTSGDGAFSNAALLTPVYTPGPGDVAAGTVTLTLTTNDPAGPCVSVNDNVTITINAAVEVEAGPAQTICSNATATLAGSFGSAATSATWSTAGDGTFNNNTLPGAVYTPGANDIANGSVTLTYTTNDPAGPCLAGSDNVVITIEQAPVVDAGAPQTICVGSTVSLAASTSGGATSASWTTSGDGTFNNVTSLTAVYTPGTGDLGTGSVTLTLTTNDPAGPCVAAVDNVLITINEVATVDAGNPQTICAGGTVTLAATSGGAATGVTWSTSGDGTFNNNSLPGAIYTPGASDIANASVTLTITTNDPAGPCLPAADDVVITINPTPTVDAGAAQTICAGSTASIIGTIGGAATTGTWSTSGDGTFDNASSLTAVYTPGNADLAAGTVVLTLTSNDPAGPCISASDNVTITIDAVASAEAGSPQTICADGTVTLAGSFSGAATSATWSTTGDGTFNNNALPAAIYTPGPDDISNGTVTLTITTNDPAGPCVPAADNVVITISPAATVDAGPPQTVCTGTSVSLAGVINGSATSATWTTAGDGTFDAINSLTAVYTPGSADLVAGTVVLTLTTNDPAGPCASVNDNITITINPGSSVDAGPPQTICAGTSTTLNGTFLGAANSATWSTSGDGTFNNITLSAAIYTPGPNDIANKSVTLTFTTDDPAGPCPAVSDNVVISITPPATVNAGAPQTICAGSTASLAGAIGGSAIIAVWSTAGDGTFEITGPLTAIYTPGTADISSGAATLTLTTNDPFGTCIAASDDVIITIDPPAIAEAGNPQTICSGVATALSGSSISGSASTGAWAIISQPAGGDGVLSDLAQTATPSAVTFTATVEGAYTLRLTTNDPAGVCGPVSDDLVVTITAVASVDAGSAQTVCASGPALLAGTVAGSPGVVWTTAGDGTFDNAALLTASYTPGPNDIASGTVTLTITTVGPCAPVSDNVVLTVIADPSVEAGNPQTICGSTPVVMNASFGGTASGLQWSTSGDGTFDDPTDPSASYTPGPGDIASGTTVTLTATATGSCPGFGDAVVITVNAPATVDAGNLQNVCDGSPVTLGATLGGTATALVWTTSGDGTFNNNTDPAAIYTPGPDDLDNGIVVLTATTNNPPGPCPASNDNVLITFSPVAGDETTPGNESWIGYVYSDAGDPTALPARINFASPKYRGFVGEVDMDNMSPASTYDGTTDQFDLNLGTTSPLQGPNVCGAFLEDFSIRYKMTKTFAPGVYRFTLGSDDGSRLLIDNVPVIDIFTDHAYSTQTSVPVCLGGTHEVEIQYYEHSGISRLTFEYSPVGAPDVISPVELCVNSAAPLLTVNSSDPDVVNFNWYLGATLLSTGNTFTPSATDLDMTTAGSTTFSVKSVYACGESESVDVVVQVLNAATLVVQPQTVCESGGIIDLRNLVAESPAGGTFVFSGHPNIAGNDFDPNGLAGSTVSIQVEYNVGSCSAAQGTLDLAITNSASMAVPGAPVVVCENSADVDLTALVSVSPGGGVFTFAGPQVSGTSFDPSGLSGIQIISVEYATGGCAAQPATFSIDVVANASLTVNNINACENGGAINLLTLVSATPAGGTFTFIGAGVTGNSFNPIGLSGVVNINVGYDYNGCTDNKNIQVNVLAPSSPLCIGGNCATVVIVPKVQPATCTNSDGQMIMSIKPFTPAVNNTGVKITIDGISSIGNPVNRTIFNDSTFTLLPAGNYTYTIEYGDPSCIKTGIFSIDRSGTVGTPVVSNIMSPVCYGTATGSVTLDVPGETGNVLEWSLDGGISDPFKPFTAGTQIPGIPAGPAPAFQQVISVRRNASDPCHSSVTVVIPESVAPLSASFMIAPATCNGNDGSITNIVPSGGNGMPYTFSIDGGLSYHDVTSFSGLSGGAYALRVRDALGCQTDIPVNITFPGFVNTTITKTNANCANPSGGSITLVVTDVGSFTVALSTDQFNPPPDAEFQPYNNPSVTFDGLAKGQYFVYVKSASAACPTRSAPIPISGVYEITFDLEPHCDNNQMSLSLVNITGESPGAPLEIQISRQLSTAPPEIIHVQFPADGEIFFDYADHTFLQTPGGYRIRIMQFQLEAVCTFSSEFVDFTIPSPLSAQIGLVEESYPDIPTGKLVVNGFTGGGFPYEVKIELDSASSTSTPYYATDFEEASVNANQQIEMVYDEIPGGRYRVQVIDSLGCALDLIARVPLDENLFIPNVFTPNGDGSNDVFFIRNLPQGGAANELVISNRWGKEVFASENYQNNWDGAEAADGVYFYRLMIAGNETLTGWVEIMRGPKP